MATAPLWLIIFMLSLGAFLIVVSINTRLLGLYHKTNLFMNPNFTLKTSRLYARAAGIALIALGLFIIFDR